MIAPRPWSAGRVAALLLATASLLLGAPGTVSAHDGEDHTTPADTAEHHTTPADTGEDDPLPVDAEHDLTPLYEIPAGADRIIGSPEAGPKPQQSGDRGGSLQFATLGAVAAAVGFIMWRIVRAARRTALRGASDTRHP